MSHWWQTAASLDSESFAPGDVGQPESGGWENVTIEDFLDAALAWTEDTRMGENQGLPSEPSWRPITTLFYCENIYE